MSDLPQIDPDQPYETIVNDLELTLAQLEDGGLSLADALVAYERGAALSARAHQLLDEAELRIETLREDGG